MVNKNSSGFSSVFARIIAVILAVLFIVTALAALMIYNIEQQAFNPAAYKRTLNNENFYQQIPALLGGALSKNLGNNAPPFAKQLSANDWKTFIEKLLPPEQLQVMTEDAITQFFAYLNGETQTFYVSLMPLKQGLAGPNGLTAALAVVKSRPDCTAAQLASMIASFGQELCNPPAQALSLARPFIQAQLENLAAAIPNQAAVLGADAPARQFNAQTFKIARLVMRLSPLIPLALLFMISLIAVRSLQSWLNWWGWPLLLTGLPGAIIGFGGAPFFRSLMERLITQRLPVDLPLETLDIIRKVVDSALREMLKPAGWEGLFLFVAGVCMVLIASFLKQREKAKLESAEAPTKMF